MKWLEKQKVATRLMLAFGLVLALTGVLGILSVVQLDRVNQTSTELEVNWLPSTRMAGDLNTATSDFRIAELQHVLSVEETTMAGFEKDLANIGASIDRTLAAYAKLVSSPAEQALFDQFKSSWTEYLAENKKLIALSRANQTEEAKQLSRGKAQQEFDEASGALVKLVELNVAGGVAASQHGDALFANARSTIFALLAVAIVLGLVFSSVIARGLVRQLGGDLARDG
jgi:CHASE3 domain sensor protein